MREADVGSQSVDTIKFEFYFVLQAGHATPYVVSTWAQGRMLRGHYRPYRRAFTGKKLLTVHAKMDWTLRPARRQTASAVSTLQCNRAHR